MSVSNGKISSTTAITLANALPYIGAAVVQANVDESWSAGTGARQFDRVAVFTFALAALGVANVDLQTDLMQDGAALGLVEVRLLQFIVGDANVGDLEVDPALGNPWLSFIQVGSTMDLAPGVNLALVAPLDGGYPVSPTNKAFTITNSDAVNAATVTMIVVGTSA